MSEVRERIEARLHECGLELEPDQVSAAESYVGLLTKWNNTVNLTSLSLQPLGDEAVDRLLVEPFLAARSIHSGGMLIDVGTGSGSPAIPLKIAKPELRLVMIESRSRKSAFLREAIRDLRLDGSEVITARLEQPDVASEYLEAADWVSIRAVRADRDLWKSLLSVIKPQGRVLWFRSADDATDIQAQHCAPWFGLDERQELLPSRRSELAILRRL